MNDTLSPTGFVAPDPEYLAHLFPGYQIIRLIACGGMGAVYEAIQVALDRAVAIKILPREFTVDESFRTAFQEEAKAMARLNHPNLISVFDFGEVDGMLFIIMEYVPGFSLFQAANGQPILQEEVIPLVAEICRGLAHAHEGGIIHRDIKPANILLNYNNVPKIGDFGLARPREKQLQEGEDIFGTLGYTAPEVLQTPQSIDHRADIFSIGVLLHELLTGMLPDVDPRSASAICQCDPRLDAVIRKATYPLPAGRYNSANEIAAEIEKISTSAGPRILQTASPTPDNHHLGRKKRKPAKKSGSMGFVLLVLLVSAGATGYLFMDKLVPPSVELEQPEPPIHSFPQPIISTNPPETRPPDIHRESNPQVTQDKHVNPKVEQLVHWNNANFSWDESPEKITFSVQSEDIAGSHDSGIFKYETWHGDGIFTLEVEPFPTAPAGSKVGIMIRESLHSNSRNILLGRNPLDETILQTRMHQEHGTAEYNRMPVSHRILRLHRSGDTITAITSADGNSWIEIGRLKLTDLPDQIFIGFAASSATHHSAEPIKASLRPITYQKIEPPTAAENEPAPIQDMDALFQRARNVMKDQANPILTEYRRTLRDIQHLYTQSASQLIFQLPANERATIVEYHATHIQSIEANGFIDANLPTELAAVPGYKSLHSSNVERQKSAAQDLIAKMLKLQNIYLTGIQNQIERSRFQNDIGAVNTLAAEKERVTEIPGYFRNLVD